MEFHNVNFWNQMNGIISIKPIKLFIKILHILLFRCTCIYIWRIQTHIVKISRWYGNRQNWFYLSSTANKHQIGKWRKTHTHTQLDKQTDAFLIYHHPQTFIIVIVISKCLKFAFNYMQNIHYKAKNRQPNRICSLFPIYQFQPDKFYRTDCVRYTHTHTHS